MIGSHLSLIVMPIVIALALATWLSLVYYAHAHPQWKHHARPRKTDAAGGVFEATRGGRQLAPIWGEPGAPVPGPRTAAAGENYQPGDLSPAGEPSAEESRAGARESTYAGVGQPPR